MIFNIINLSVNIISYTWRGFRSYPYFYKHKLYIFYIIWCMKLFYSGNVNVDTRSPIDSPKYASSRRNTNYFVHNFLVPQLCSGSALKNRIGVLSSIAPILPPCFKTCSHVSVFCYIIQTRQAHRLLCV